MNADNGLADSLAAVFPPVSAGGQQALGGQVSLVRVSGEVSDAAAGPVALARRRERVTDEHHACKQAGRTPVRHRALLRNIRTVAKGFNL